MISKIKIDNFKSLVDFELELNDFNCIVGLNGSGKSTVLQAIDFLASLMTGDVSGWLERREWSVADINSKLIKKSNIEFEVTWQTEQFGELRWGGTFNRAKLKCTKEYIKSNNVPFLEVTENEFRVVYVSDLQVHIDDIDKFKMNPSTYEIVFDYEGSLLSSLKIDPAYRGLKEVKQWMSAIQNLELISPAQLRKSAKSSGGKLGVGGEKFSALLHELGVKGKEHIKQELAAVYTQLDKINTRALRSGWKRLEITEHYGDNKLISSARHINDGMLRLMAILSQLFCIDGLILFDEIENGINPELIEFLIDHLVEAEQQILVTTHSPLILNFLTDEVAKKSVIYLYKNALGHTKAIRLFDIPSLKEKLNLLGPGEAFVDTDLTRLQDEILALPAKGVK